MNKKAIQKALPDILTIAGSIGVVTTAILSARAGAKFSKLETTKEKVLCCAPAVITGAVTIACVIGSYKSAKRINAALAASYALLETRMEAQKHAYPPEVKMEVMAQNITEIEENEEDEELYYDAYSDRYFQCTPAKFLKVIFNVNRLLQMDGRVCLNDIYDDLGFEHDKDYDDMGWTVNMLEEESCYNWIEVTDTKTPVDVGLMCHCISFDFEPGSVDTRLDFI